MAQEGISAGSWGLGCRQEPVPCPRHTQGQKHPQEPSSHPQGIGSCKRHTAGSRTFAWPTTLLTDARLRGAKTPIPAQVPEPLLQAAEAVLDFPSFCSLFFVLPSAERRSQASLVTLPLFTASFSSIFLLWPGASQPAPRWHPQTSPRGSPAPWTPPSSSQCSHSPSQHVPTASLWEQTTGASFLESFYLFFKSLKK